MPNVGIVGGGIVGLTLARQLTRVRDDVHVTVFDKEDAVAQHQTSHNSGVVHAGVYYRPGTLKATLCRRGTVLLREFCEAEGLPYNEIGKLVVASDDVELGRLDELERRAAANGVPRLRRLNAAEIRELEPNVVGTGALLSPTTAITDYAAVARRIADQLMAAGHEVRLGQEVTRVFSRGSEGVAEVAGDGIAFDRLIVCAGLGTDRLVGGGKDGFPDDPIAVPFRGEYFRLTGDAKGLVGRLIYPVPDPRYPFLGIHFTPTVAGDVLIGPNAVLATASEGYRRSDVSVRDSRRMATSKGFWRMAAQNWRTGVYEMRGSFSRRAYIARARRYVPSLNKSSVERGLSGVRTQAIGSGGEFIDDIVLQEYGAVSLVRNAPSPAATSSLALAEHLVNELKF